jgi:hypothetical protein
MIYVKMYGGLGNQQFQYAAGLFLSKILNVEFSIDTSWFHYNKFNTPRNLDILDYRIENKLSQNTRSEYFINRFNKRLNLFNPRQNYFLESRGDKLTIRSNINYSKKIIIDGYWADQNIVNEVLTDLKDLFTPRSFASLKCNKLTSDTFGKNSVAVHIRRGDYVSSKKTNSYHGVLGLHYYREAYNIMQLNFPNSDYFIFSDDIEWCEDNLKFIKNSTIINLGSSSHDQHAMSLCNHNIIANSTFSWWAAKLNKNNNYVIAPQNWFSQGDGGLDIYSKTWHIL